MSGFTKQVISAGAASTSANLELINILSQQRQQNQEVQGELASIEGAATLASGQAQEAAYNQEADQSSSRALQTTAEGAGNLVAEGTGEIGERTANSTAKANETNTNVNNYDKWDRVLDNPSQARVQARLNNPQNIRANDEPVLTEQEVSAIKEIKITADGKATDPDVVLQNGGITKARLEAAARRDDPALADLRKEVTRKLKAANKRAESNSSGIDRRRTQWKTLVNSSSQVFQAKQSSDIANAQKAEAEIKLMGTQADFAKDSIARTNKSLDDSNSGLGNSISGVIQASNKEWEANARV